MDTYAGDFCMNAPRQTSRGAAWDHQGTEVEQGGVGEPTLQ